MLEPGGNKRQDGRQPVLKTAKIRFGESVVDCLVLDLSGSGARVSNDAFIPFPEEVLFELRSGGVWNAERRWQRGMETGFAFTRFAGLHREAISEASGIYDQLRTCGLLTITERLAAARHYDHPDLKAATQAAEDAVKTLETVLRTAVGRG